MPEAKIEIKAGGAEFSATGDQDWVGTQLDKFLKNAAQLAAVSSDATPATGAADKSGGQKGNAGIASKPLATYLKEQDATTNQVKKFYATAVWLHAKGSARLTTGDITKALKASNQTRLNNASDCLAQNVKKGLCEKDGNNQFCVTE